MATTETNFFTG